MKKITPNDILKELYKGHGHVINKKRTRNIKAADFIYRITKSAPLQYIKRWYQQTLKLEEDVLQSYDRMAGVYNSENKRLYGDDTVILCKIDKEYTYLKIKEAYQQQMDYTIKHIFQPHIKDGMRILEVGAGETTTIHNIIDGIAPTKAHWSGLELSWSRIAEGKRWAKEHDTLGQFDTLVAASALNIPYEDNAFDIVFTNGCIEQIRYNTEQAVSEILRVARNKVILYEPTYELGDKYQRKYLKGAQYCRGLPKILEKLGANVTYYELAPHSLNPFCCYSITVIEKTADETPLPSPQYCCPKCKNLLKTKADGLYCDTFQCSSIYPVIWGVPCLRIEDAVFASKYEEMITA